LGLKYPLTERDESTGIVIHICMKMTEENSLCSYFYLKLAKMSCFSLKKQLNVPSKAHLLKTDSMWHCWEVRPSSCPQIIGVEGRGP
jgi:hypothetical protein